MTLARLNRLTALEDEFKTACRAQWKRLFEAILKWREHEIMRLKLRDILYLLETNDGLSCLDHWRGGEYPPDVREAALAWEAFGTDPTLKRWDVEIGLALTAFREHGRIPETPLPPLPSLEALERDSAATRYTFETVERYADQALDPPRVLAWCRYFELFTLEEEAKFRIHQSL